MTASIRRRFLEDARPSAGSPSRVRGAAMRAANRGSRSGAPTTATAATRRPTARETASGRVVQGPERERHEPDHLIMVAVLALAALGILMIYSSGAVTIASRPGSSQLEGVLPEMLWAVMGTAAMLLLSRLDYRWLRVVSVPLFILAIALLIVVLLPSLGPIRHVVTGGSARWLLIGPLPRMHPAEVAKLALVIYLAHWMARRGTTIGSLTHGTLPFLVIAAPIILLVALEPDLGTTGVITLTAFCLFFVAGASLAQLLVTIPVGVAAVTAYVLTNPYQLMRVATFLDPLHDANRFHTEHGLWALALGGLLGSGLGQSRQPGGLPLPNADNDFIFAMVGQELGLLGGVLVIGLFLFFAWRGIRVALAAPDTFGALLAVGITAWLTLQAFINIGVVLVLLPVTGITLPFVSSGGSSLMVSFAAVGILLSISRETLPRGTAIDAHPGSSRGDGRAHLSRPRRASVADATAP